uniref:Nucleoside phosphorylase domain-containing protein n=1 Tax=Fervidicoccus fontis TaxID=683846 RepID=A0A7J3ZK31_9CREN
MSNHDYVSGSDVLDVIPLEKLPAHVILTDNKWLFNETLRQLDENPTVSDGEYGVKVARGLFRGVELAIVYYGMGSSSIVALIEELYRKGVRAVEKVGFGVYATAQSPPARVPIGAVRLDKVTENLYPLEVPAVPSFSLTSEIVRSLETLNVDHQEDLVISIGAMTRGFDNDLKALVVALWRKLGINVMDLDTATLYLMSYARKIKASSIIIPVIPLGDLQTVGCWINYKVDERRREQVDTYRGIVSAALESIYHFREKAAMEFQAKLLEKRVRRGQHE